MNTQKKSADIQPNTLKSTKIISGNLDKIKREAVRQWNPIIPDIITVELCQIQEAFYIGIIPIDEDAVFCQLSCREDALYLEASQALELFQKLWDAGVE